MGIDNRKPIIVEFNGLPGSGKTTITRQLRKELLKDGKSVLLQYFKNKWDKNCYSMLFRPSYWRLIVEMFNYSKSFHPNGSLYHSLLLASFVRMYRGFVKTSVDGYLILDQAIIQLYISLAHQDELLCTPKLEKLLKLNRLYDLPIVIVNCNVNEVLSNQRIENRRLNGSRVESMSIQERYSTLEIQTRNFNIIRDVVRRLYPDLLYIDIDTSEPLDRSVEIIMSNIDGFYNSSKIFYNEI